MTHGKLLTGNAAAAWGARLADVDYVPAFPITPQTEMIELLAQWATDGTIPARFVTLDSEHSMLTAAGAAAAAGARVYTATSSQGLLYGFEMLYTIAGWRVGWRHRLPSKPTTVIFWLHATAALCKSTRRPVRRWWIRSSWRIAWQKT